MDHLVQDVRAIFAAAVHGVQADALLDQVDVEALTRRSLSEYRRVIVAGIGKASLAMAGVAEARWGERLGTGAVVVPEGYPASLSERLPRPERVDVLEAGHPVPDARSARAGRRLLELASGCSEDDLLLALISGGGTALTATPAEGLSLEDVQAPYRLMLNGGVDIHAMNAVRKHLTRIGGGQLARAAQPAEVVALVVSDVARDDLSVIASGPTVPDPSTFADAVQVLKAHDLWNEVPEAVQKHLEAGRRGERPETPGPDEAFFGRVRTDLIGTNHDALGAAKAAAEQCGYAARIVAEQVSGEAREVGRMQAEDVRAAEKGPRCLLWGGETTVTVRGEGTGGRNQELALAAALALDSTAPPIAFLSGGTDGIDGPTDAAGAWVTPGTAAVARAPGLDPPAYLDDNDAYSFFEQMGALLRPGPTHTNVMDVQIALVSGG